VSEVISTTPIYLSDSKAVVNFLHSKYDNLGRSIEFWIQRTSDWWLNNPYFNDKLPIGWGLWNGKELVGYLGCIFTALSYKGILHKSLNLTCWHVEPVYRSYSLDLFIMANKFMPEAVYFNTSPTLQVEKILKAAKYQRYISGKDRLMCKIMPLNLQVIKIDSKFGLPLKFIKPVLLLFDAILNRYIRLVWNNKLFTVTDLNGVSPKVFNQFIQRTNLDKLTIDRSEIFYKWLLGIKNKKYHVLIVKKNTDSEIIAVGLFHSYLYKSNQILELIDYFSINDRLYANNLIIRKMISFISKNKKVFKNFIAISTTDYSGIRIENCPGKSFFRSRNNKYYNTSNPTLKFLFETNEYNFTAQGDMYL
jgi:hypothetical protein